MPTPTIQTLDALLDAVRTAPETFDLTDLPTFGGAEPRNTVGVWSWDADRLLIGESTDEMRIVSRAQFTELTGRDA